MKGKVMAKYILVFFMFFSFIYSQEITNEQIAEIKEEKLPNKNEASVDCLILQDENSIICKFEILREESDRDIIVQWIDPQGDISRSRNMTVPAGHGSIYDYRYIKGRLLGNWTFKVILDSKEYTAQFELK